MLWVTFKCQSGSHQRLEWWQNVSVLGRPLRTGAGSYCLRSPTPGTVPSRSPLTDVFAKLNSISLGLEEKWVLFSLPLTLIRENWLKGEEKREVTTFSHSYIRIPGMLTAAFKGAEGRVMWGTHLT